MKSRISIKLNFSIIYMISILVLFFSMKKFVFQGINCSIYRQRQKNRLLILRICSGVCNSRLRISTILIGRNRSIRLRRRWRIRLRRKLRLMVSSTCGSRRKIRGWGLRRLKKIWRYKIFRFCFRILIIKNIQSKMKNRV